jgi:ribosomal protein S18 acetylase RimI-like enzyme
LLRAHAWILPIIAGPGFLARFHIYESHTSDLRRRYLSGPHWYLQMLAVDPQYQGRGYAACLLHTMFARLDRDRLPCCLDTENGKNVAFYARFGFKLMEATVIPKSEVRCWFMKRDPNDA